MRWGPPKLVQTADGFTAVPGDPTWQASANWTLHVPPDDIMPVHSDPCLACTTIELSESQLQALGVAFHAAWGLQADLTTIPKDCFLFGQPPPTSVYAAPAPMTTAHIVALVSEGTMCDAVTRLRGVVVEQVGVFRDRVCEREPDVIVLARDVVGQRLDEVLEAIRAAWTEAPKVESEEAQ
jgi:hypothetical protein